MHTIPKVALVTGASSGFGQATAALLAAQGFLVFGTSRAPLHKEASSFELLPLDVRSETSVQMCVQTILGRTGRIDLLVNNAGFAQAGALEENSLEEAHAQFETNVFGVLRLLKAVIPAPAGQRPDYHRQFSPGGGGDALSRSLCLQQIRAGGHDRGTLPRTSSFSHQGVISRAHLFSHEIRRSASGDTAGCV